VPNRTLVVAALAALLATACAAPQPRVRRLDANETTDLSGRWNDTDSRLVADEMIQDSLSRPWLAQATGRLRGPPAVIVQGVRNTSMEHINTQTFVEDLQRALINSGRVNFVASADERGDLRSERADQDVNASEETRKAHGQERGADYALSGTISSITDRDGGEAVVFYQINLKLLDLKTNQIVWNGQKKIKKAVSRPAATW
jgi:uncharacterized protein (TIGR02722 family)